MITNIQKTMKNINEQKLLPSFVLKTNYRCSHCLPFSIYNSKHIKFGFKRLNVLLKAVWESELQQWQKEGRKLPSEFCEYFEGFYFPFQATTCLNFFLTTTTMTGYYILPALLSSLARPSLFPACLQQLTYIFPLYLSNLILTSLNSMLY